MEELIHLDNIKIELNNEDIVIDENSSIVKECNIVEKGSFTSDSESDSTDSENGTLNNVCGVTNKVRYSRMRIMSMSSLSDLSSSSEDENAEILSDKFLWDGKPSLEEKEPKKSIRDAYEDIELPKIENLLITVKEEKAKEIGHVEMILQNLVIVQAFRGIPPIDMQSVLFLNHGKTTLGHIFEVFGKVDEPLYVVRFNSSEEIIEKSVVKGTSVFYAPSMKHTKYIILDDLKCIKGSDASWIDDKEPPLNALDYSDDEKEKTAKKQAANDRENSDDRINKRIDNNSYRTSIYRDKTNDSKKFTFRQKVVQRKNYQNSCPSPLFGEAPKIRSNLIHLPRNRLIQSNFGSQNLHSNNSNSFNCGRQTFSRTNQNFPPLENQNLPFNNQNLPRFESPHLHPNRNFSHFESQNLYPNNRNSPPPFENRNLRSSNPNFPLLCPVPPPPPHDRNPSMCGRSNQSLPLCPIPPPSIERNISDLNRQNSFQFPSSIQQNADNVRLNSPYMCSVRPPFMGFNDYR